MCASSCPFLTQNVLTFLEASVFYIFLQIDSMKWSIENWYSHPSEMFSTVTKLDCYCESQIAWPNTSSFRSPYSICAYFLPFLLFWDDVSSINMSWRPRCLSKVIHRKSKLTFWADQVQFNLAKTSLSCWGPSEFFSCRLTLEVYSSMNALW